jgi:hypothetical protein
MKWISMVIVRPFVPLVAILLASPAAHGLEDENAKKFEAMMSGSRLEGQFNVVGPQGTSPPQLDLYMVSSLKRGEGDTWVFSAQMSYGGKSEAPPIEIPVRVLWAEGTPLLVMDEQRIEGMEGAFTVRLLFHDNLYAGTWRHGTVGGHMWGRLVEATAPPSTSN